MSRDPYNPYSEKTIGLAMAGVVFFCAVTGLGFGAFIMQPRAGALAGAAFGVVAGILLVPPLMRDWRD